MSALGLELRPRQGEGAGRDETGGARRGDGCDFMCGTIPAAALEFVRAFWTAAAALDRNAVDLTEDRRFPFCTPEGLTSFGEGRRPGSSRLRLRSNFRLLFKDFEDYWHPFTLGAWTSSGLLQESRSRSPAAVEGEDCSDSLPRGEDGSIPLKTRAWAVRAKVG